jgi:hypothetical protein
LESGYPADRPASYLWYLSLPHIRYAMKIVFKP